MKVLNSGDNDNKYIIIEDIEIELIKCLLRAKGYDIRNLSEQQILWLAQVKGLL